MVDKLLREEQIMHRKIYIMGPVGSGKTTVANQLSKEYQIPYYELDKVAWDDDHGNIKRSNEKILEIFHEILQHDSWIIEDVGRKVFQQGKNEADIIYYIKLPRWKSYFRVTKRWIKQRLGKERYNHPPTFQQWIYYLSTVNSYYRKEKTKLKSLEIYHDKLKFIYPKNIKKMIHTTQT